MNNYYEWLNLFNVKKIIYINLKLYYINISMAKCYKGGNHLLNLANFSRLLIGEIYNYEKLIYLDSDSLTQCDLYEKMKDIEIKKTY